jgi:hypothetical protein
MAADPSDLATNQCDQAMMRAALAAETRSSPYAGEPIPIAPQQPIDSANLESVDMIVNRAFGSIYSVGVAWSDAYEHTDHDIEAS